MVDTTMNEAMADSSSNGARVLGIVRKLRTAGMEQLVAEAVGEVLSELPTRGEMREEILASEKRMEFKFRAMLAEAMAANFRNIILAVIGLLGVQTALLVLFLGQ